MNMINRVVNALDKCDAEYDGPTRGIYEAFAKAAITAMREPSEEMLKAAEDQEIPGYEYNENGDPDDVWRAMIEAALTEEKK